LYKQWNVREFCPAGDCWPAELADFWPTGPR